MPRSYLPLLALLPLFSGCVAVAAAGVVGVGGFQYQRNEARQDFPLDLQETWKASLEGLKRLAIEPEQSELGPTEGRIVHQDLVVVVERHPEGFTRVRVRCGTFYSSDHQRRAQLVLQEIEGSIEGLDELKAWSEKVEGNAPPPQQQPPTAPKS